MKIFGRCDNKISDNMAMSDAESDSYSLLEAPRPRVQAVMAQALAEGRLPQLVLDKTADLSRAIALSLEALGLGTSTPEEQVAAGRALVGLCTHIKLRPAVDNLLVLRRLCRIIELTDSATALGASAEALFAIADDADWKNKGGSVSEAVRDALLRCVSVLVKVARDMQRTDPRVAAPDSARRDLTSDDQDQQTSLAAAAAAVLKPPVLHLLNSDQLAETAGALASCLAAGISPSQVPEALAALLQHQSCDSAQAALLAAAEVPGAVVKESALPGLLASLAAHTAQQHAAGAALASLSASAYSCIKAVLLACAEGSVSGDISAQAVLQCLEADALATLTPLLLDEAKQDTIDVLRMLLVLASHSTKDECCAATDRLVALVAAEQQHRLLPAALAAAESYVQPLVGSGPSAEEQVLVAALLRIASGLITTGALAAQTLHAHAPSVVGLAVAALKSGEVSGDKPASSFHPKLTAAAAELMQPLLAWAADAHENPWLPVADIARALVRRVAEEASSFEELGTPGVRCLVLALQMMESEELWKGEEQHMPKLAEQLGAWIKTGQNGHSMLQLAAAALVSMSSMTTAFSTPSVQISVLGLSQIALEQVVAVQEAPSTVDSLASIAGTVNAVLACLCPQRALTGLDSLPLQPHLPRKMLGARGQVGSPDGLVLNLSTAYETPYRAPPKVSVQLQWGFERTVNAVTLTSAFTQFAEHYSNGYYGSDRYLGTPHTTLASTTAEPLVRALGAATERLTQLAGEMVVAEIAVGNDGAKALRTALKVAGNAAAVLAKCMPPGTTEL